METRRNDIDLIDRAIEALDTIEFVGAAMEAAGASEDACGRSADVCRLGVPMFEAAIGELRAIVDAWESRSADTKKGARA